MNLFLKNTTAHKKRIKEWAVANKYSGKTNIEWNNRREANENTDRCHKLERLQNWHITKKGLWNSRKEGNERFVIQTTHKSE